MDLPEMSFNFGKYNSLRDLGIICEIHDTLLPSKRERKVEIPGRNGMYDFGSINFDERVIECECKLIEEIPKSKLREVAYKLSGKKPLTFWDEPDKYYIAELFDPTEIDNIADRLWLEFTLTFTCEPFAYGETISQPITDGQNPISYKGTAESDCVIIIRNRSNSSLSNITITAIEGGT